MTSFILYSLGVCLVGFGIGYMAGSSNTLRDLGKEDPNDR